MMAIIIFCKCEIYEWDRLLIEVDLCLQSQLPVWETCECSKEMHNQQKTCILLVNKSEIINILVSAGTLWKHVE